MEASGPTVRKAVNAKQPVAFISRTEKFSACHRLHSTQLSEKENQDIFGKCNHPNCHGHNYTVEVHLKGKVDPVTGMVLNITDLKQYMKVAIMDVMDHKSIDKDIPYFKETVSTAENIAVFIWQSLCQIMPDPSLLYEIKVHETDKNVAFFRGEYADM
ncbi:hypothetical protein NP493_863g00033 [Ridgeia piscesae]|uniref:6-pyruvoyltetrahydropterin synthase n=1 Tax=Ridgeia piscesae TaxID=27915 RepID=A0AAD9KLZ2_RIDPI|nr:hypothetical protein NP493_863g00033 [Ridgeia piscesae]